MTANSTALRWNLGWASTEASGRIERISGLAELATVFLARPEIEVFVATDTLSEAAQKIVGENGVRRLQEFVDYPVGWDSGKGHPLARKSVAVLEAVLRELRHEFKTQPSIFLTRAGNLQLAWESDDGAPIEMECGPERIEYYVGKRDAEGDVIASQEGIRKIAQLIAEAG